MDKLLELAIFLYFFNIITLFLALFTGLYIITVFGKNRLGRFIGLLCIKPAAVYPFWWIVIRTPWFRMLDGNWPLVIVVALPEIVISFAIGFYYKDQLKKGFLFLLGDTIRWFGVVFPAIVFLYRGYTYLFDQRITNISSLLTSIFSFLYPAICLISIHLFAAFNIVDNNYDNAKGHFQE